MLTKEMLDAKIPVLHSTNTGDDALSFMEELKVRHLPVVDRQTYSFLLSEKDLFRMNDSSASIAGLSVFAPCAYGNMAVIDVMHLMSKDKLSVLPVIDQNGGYLGAVSLETLIDKLAEIANAGAHGSIVAIEMHTLDYDLSNIVRLAESNNAKIITLFTFPEAETDKLTTLIKIDLEDASPFLRSLERFNYHVLYYSQKEGLVDEILRKRLDELMFYLKM